MFTYCMFIQKRSRDDHGGLSEAAPIDGAGPQIDVSQRVHFVRKRGDVS